MDDFYGGRRFNRDKVRDVFDAPDSINLSSNSIDLPTKLTLLFKKGFGRKYTIDPKNLPDAPISKKHSDYLKGQVAKATYDHYVRSTTLEVDRRKSYEDFIVMDYSPEIHSALDIYADECLTKNESDEIIEIECDNSKIKMVLENLFNDILDVDHNLWQWTRQMCKFGNHFVLLDVQPEKGIVGFLPIPVQEMRREEAYDNEFNTVKFIWDAQQLIFDQWQIAHFRLLSDSLKYPYGTAAIESTRLIWKQLQLAEDAMLVNRIVRAPERRVFYIDVGNLNPDDVEQYIQSIKNTIKRTPLVNESTGAIDSRYNAMAVDEDFFIPRRGDKNTEIDTLPGASNLDDIADIEYLQGKMFASLKIPKAYLTFDDQINAKATLSSEDFRFARTINRIQQAIISTLTNMAIVHLYSLGYRDKDQLTSFSINLTNPSTQTEIEKLEIWNERASSFTSLWNESTLSPISYVWGMKNIFSFSDKEIEIILKQQYLEGKMKLAIEEESNPAPEEPMPEDGDQESQFQDESGNSLPASPPEGQVYVDAETGEAVEESIRKLVGTLQSIYDNKKPSKKVNLTSNTMLSSNTTKMLESLDYGMENYEGKVKGNIV